MPRRATPARFFSPIAEAEILRRAAEIRAEWDAAGAALPQAVRQQILDSVWDGAQLGEVAARMGCSLYAVMGVLNANIEPAEVPRLTLRRIAR